MPEPFDTARARFYLVAAVFGVYAFAALSGLYACIFALVPIERCGEGKLGEAFALLLASALAFAAGQASNK